jgi:peptidoglycan/LPS O-acetylase OafA/YrhL
VSVTITNKKLDYVDAVRGWAILLVITTHVGNVFPELPYPVKKLTNFGWHGVQLFFLASAVTLLLSWARRSEPFPQATQNFFIRRFLRIAPLYYLGALIYLVADGTVSQFSLPQALRSFLFVNAWHPDWMPTTGAWAVVPGGWSIGVEFTFYLIFPLLASIVTTLPRALAFFVLTVPLACAANQWAGQALQAATPAYDPQHIRNFLYFWFPNQLPVFALGFVLFFLLQRPASAPINARASRCLMLLCAACFIVTAEFWLGHGSFFGWNTLLPPILLASLIFMLFIHTLARGTPSLLAHRWIRRLGELSFSAYILHFMCVDHLSGPALHLINRQATGLAAVGMLVLLWFLVLGCTVLLSMLTYRYIEQPFIRLAGRWIARRRGNRPSALPVTRTNPG